MYYINRNGETIGPYSMAEVRQRLARGLLAASDYCWTEGMADWVLISESETFRERTAATPAPPARIPREMPKVPRTRRQRRKVRRETTAEENVSLPEETPAPHRPRRRPISQETLARVLFISGALLTLFFLFFYNTRVNPGPVYTGGVQAILGGPANIGRVHDRAFGLALSLLLLGVGSFLLFVRRRA